ncbi:MAG: hypothetical protein LUF29_08895 [Oscillospiraceae bacterium]|nr:hypothetical protein [Oscillospiraceae bacterium]
MKRFIGLLVAVAVIFGVSAVAVFSADVSDEDLLVVDSAYAQAVVLENNGLEVTPTDAYHLTDVSGNETYTCVEFEYDDGGSVGWMVIDLTTYNPTIYSTQKQSPFYEYKDSTIIYSGGFDFAIVQPDGETALDGLREEIVPIEDVQSDARAGLEVLSLREREAKLSELN